MTKRLRGVGLEKEMGGEVFNKRPTLSKGKESKLATALLSLWAHGKISATTCRWLAEQAVLDGNHHCEMVDMAKAGSHGQYPNNIHRDFLARFAKDVAIPEAMIVPVRCINTKTLKKEKEDAAIFLPHLMFASLARLPNFGQLFPVEHLEDFWSTLEKGADPALEGHPMKTRGWKKFTIPLFLHGDGAQYAKDNSLMIWSWGALMTCFNSLQSKYLLSCWPKNATCKETWDDLLKEICWSFATLAKGIHPTHDSSGKPLKKGSPFYENKGLPLANGYRGVIWCIMGDAEWQANSLGLPHWASTKPCHECDATSNPATIEKWFKNIEIDTQNFKKVSHQQALLKPCSENLVFSMIPGLSTRYVRGDALHILFVGGIYSHLLGSTLHYLCWKDPGRQKKTSR